MKRAILVTLLYVSLASSAAAQTIQVNKENRTIAITTTDEAEAMADVARVSIGYVVYGADSDNTYADGSRISNAVLAALRAAGVTDKQIASKSQNLQPLGEEDKLRFGKGIRFRLGQSWQVKCSAADAAKILNIAVGAGANDSGDITWSLANEKSLQAEAAEKALAQARDIAEHMAQGLNSKLGALVYASNQVPMRGFAGGLLQTESASLAARVMKTAPLALVPDKVTRSATVYAVFAIE